MVKWGWIDSTAQYTIRGRKLPYFWFGLFHHSHYGWELTAAASDSDWTDEHPAYDATSPVDSLEHPITDLELYEVYAFQLNYTIGSKRYFSAREAYVWPSDRAGGAGAHAEERVATFPLNYPQPDKKYSYVVCEETFPGRITEWKDFIKHAFSQWELATDGLVSTERVDLLDENNNKMECPDFSEYIEDVRDQVLDYMENSDPTREQIEEYVKDLLDNYEDAGLEAKQGMDARINDITMIDDNDDQDVLVGARVFAQVSRRVSSGNCGPGAIACASVSEARLDDGSTIFTTDIILTSSTFEGMSLDLPGTDTTASEGEIPFNTCLSTEVKYSTLARIHRRTPMDGVRTAEGGG